MLCIELIAPPHTPILLSVPKFTANRIAGPYAKPLRAYSPSRLRSQPQQQGAREINYKDGYIQCYNMNHFLVTSHYHKDFPFSSEKNWSIRLRKLNEIKGRNIPNSCLIFYRFLKSFFVAILTRKKSYTMTLLLGGG